MDIKPCPFCGQPGKTQRKRYQRKGFMLPHEKFGQGSFYFAGCFGPGCDIRPHAYADTNKEAIELWNKRPDNAK